MKNVWRVLVFLGLIIGKSCFVNDVLDCMVIIVRSIVIMVSKKCWFIIYCNLDEIKLDYICFKIEMFVDKGKYWKLKFNN